MSKKDNDIYGIDQDDYKIDSSDYDFHPDEDEEHDDNNKKELCNRIDDSSYVKKEESKVKPKRNYWQRLRRQKAIAGLIVMAVLIPLFIIIKIVNNKNGMLIHPNISVTSRLEKDGDVYYQNTYGRIHIVTYDTNELYTVWFELTSDYEITINHMRFDNDDITPIIKDNSYGGVYTYEFRLGEYKATAPLFLQIEYSLVEYKESSKKYEYRVPTTIEVRQK